MTALTRRNLLKSASGGAALTLAGLPAARVVHGANGAMPTAGDQDMVERLASKIMETPPDQVVDLICGKLENGLTGEQLLAACFNAGIRFHGHHSGYVAHPVHVVSQASAGKSALLPLFYYLSVLRFRAGRSRIERIEGAPLPVPPRAEGVFHGAMQEGDGVAAARALIALSRELGPQRAYEHLWTYGAERNDRSGGHTAVSVVNTYRSLLATNWRSAETALQFAVADAKSPPMGLDVEGVNRARAAAVGKLPKTWASTASDRGATVELVNLYREGARGEACERTFRLLQDGTVTAGSVWDALFLTTAELIVRYQWVGQKMLAGHSVTCTNALHFMFRTATQPDQQLYALIEAVEWATRFLARERARPALREFSLLGMEPNDQATDDEALEQIFGLLPPRRFASMSRIGFEDVDTAMRVTLAWARTRPSYEPFIERALHLICRKSTPEVHDFKFPMALFENLQHATPIWQPYLLAASVHVLHGTDMEDSSIVAHARERLAAF